MKRLLGLSAALLLLLGCGNPASVNLGQGPSYAQDGEGVLDSITSQCSDAFTAQLVQKEFVGYSPGITFSSGPSNPIRSKAILDGATVEQRCSELKNHFSGAPIIEGSNVVPNTLGIDVDFDVAGEQEEQMRSGKTVNLRVKKANLSFTDGSLKNSSAELELRCPGMASVTCQVREIGDYRDCEAYHVKYTDRCTFKTELLFFSFSDHKTAQIDIKGELDISTGSGTQLKITNMSWVGLH